MSINDPIKVFQDMLFTAQKEDYKNGRFDLIDKPTDSKTRSVINTMLQPYKLPVKVSDCVYLVFDLLSEVFPDSITPGAVASLLYGICIFKGPFKKGSPLALITLGDVFKHASGPEAGSIINTDILKSLWLAQKISTGNAVNYRQFWDLLFEGRTAEQEFISARDDVKHILLTNGAD